jgi:hypothetical protein
VAGKPGKVLSPGGLGEEESEKENGGRFHSGMVCPFTSRPSCFVVVNFFANSGFLAAPRYSRTKNKARWSVSTRLKTSSKLIYQE